MEIVRKRISLEKSRTRVNSGLPYIQYNGNGEILSPDKLIIVDKEHDVVTEKEVFGTNYGNFQCDIKEGTPLYNSITGTTSSLVTIDVDLYGNVISYIRTVNLFRRYNELLDILRTGLHLKHIKNEGCEGRGDYGNTYLSNFEYTGTTYDFLRKAKPVDMFDDDGNQLYVNIDNNLYQGVVDNPEYVIVLTNYQYFVELGGQELIDIVDKLLVDPDSGSTTSVSVDDVCVPYISIPLLLTINETDLGVMTPYTDENEFIYSGTEHSYDIAHAYNPDISGDTKIYDNVDDSVSTWILGESIGSGDTEEKVINVESKLETLRVPKYFVSDDNKPLPGLFIEFPHDGINPFFNCIYCSETVNGWYGYEDINGKKGKFIDEVCEKPIYNGQYTNVEYTISEKITEQNVISGDNQFIVDKFERIYRWWEVNPSTNNNLICADGEDIEWGDNTEYQTISIFGTLLYYIEEAEKDAKKNEGTTIEDYLHIGSSYNFLVKYDNTEQTPMVVPYMENVVLNKSYDVYNEVSSYTGDYVISIDESDDEITFEYMIGAKFDSGYTNVIEDGIYYRETYGYEKSVSATTTLDNVENTIYWYNKIYFDDKKESVYNEDFNLTRNTVISTLDSMTYGDVWLMNESNSGSVINTPLIKEEYLMSAAMDAVIDVDVSIDRGNATAFEKHLILGECNTFQDVENYRNNYYNL